MLCWFPKSAWYQHQLGKYFLKPVQLKYDILRSAATFAETQPIAAKAVDDSTEHPLSGDAIR